MLPLRYAVRNLFRDPSRLIQAVGGSALVCLLMMGATAFTQGMSDMLTTSGDPRNVILLGAGSESSLQRSEIPDQAAGIAEGAIPGITQWGDQRAVSPELHFMGYVQVADQPPVQTLLRGMTSSAFLTHASVSLIEGVPPSAGTVNVGRLAWRSLGVSEEAVAIGQTLQFDDQTFTIAGHFAAPGTVMESEIWMDLNDLRTLTQRESLSGVILRLQEPDPADAQLFTAQRLDLELTAMQETSYYATLSDFYAPIRTMTWITAALIGAGALVGGFNTLYAAFSSRIAELATLQVLGYSRTAILLSLIQESLMACLTGALLAGLLSSWLLDGLVVSFSMGTFTLRTGPAVLLSGIITGSALGLFGSIPPAIRCFSPPLPSALRSAA